MTVSFSGQVALLTGLLERHRDIVERIEGRLLNARGNDPLRDRNRAYVERAFQACFFDAPGLPRDLAQLKGQLAAAHVADGFEPVVLDKYAQELDPLELTVRAWHYWEHHRWPGRNGRVAYARSLYAVFILRQLEQLSLRIWDEGHDRAGDRLREVQRLLDRLNDLTSPNVLVRDARWLIQTAQGPLTRHLHPYFKVAGQISESFTADQRLELHKAGARLAGGHLRSQLRYRAAETRRPIDDPEVLAVTRNSNSMDAALLVRDLVPLLEAYKTMCVADDPAGRLDLADAILQGVSADPELFLTRLDLLAPCTAIEDVFIDRGEDGRAHYTRTGREHLGLLERYGALIGDLAESLTEDAAALDPSRTAYSPFGIAYGFCADILSNMALEALVSQPSHGLSLEDTFASRGGLENKRARVCGWEKLPARAGEREHFEHSAEWAGEIFRGMMDALQARATHKGAANASGVCSGRLFAVPESRTLQSLPDGFLPAGIVPAQEHCVTSDLPRAFASGATAFPKSQIVSDRNEGRYLASAESGGKWFGVSKIVLTACTSQGKDALITDVPAAVLDVLRLTCPGLLVIA